MLCAKFGWNSPSGSEKEDESLQSDGRQHLYDNSNTVPVKGQIQYAKLQIMDHAVVNNPNPLPKQAL